ncbi:AAA family ATPase [Haloarcula litorea]|uniref:AAA family ATPase n=1 Tax=Haloarcula litorea TaxID=3032579 RepID=UPI0023E8E911|nr:ATP-binding protein [Halomicroarcula sp. GDY20]
MSDTAHTTESGSEQWLVTVCGLPGVGKSTTAEEIASRLDATLLRTDTVRTDVVEDPTYEDAEVWLVYGALFERARARLAEGESVVLDGTFKTPDHRRRAETIAGKHARSGALVWVTCEESVARERIRNRTDDPSEADTRVYEELSAEFDPPADADLVVDNSGSIDEMHRQIGELF